MNAEPQDSGRWESIDCPVCEGRQFSALFELRGEPFVRCRGCGLVLINPRPRAGELLPTYDARYSERYVAKAAAKLARARRWVRRVARRRGGGRWLDIGCSAGFVMKAAQEAGFEAYGCDVEAAGVRHARERLGLTRAAVGTLQAQGYPAGLFDVVSLYDVIEHVPDLHGFLEEILRVLAPGGLLDLRTPDVGHWRVPARLERWDAIKPSEHLYYFDRHTLARLLARHGLSVLARRRSLKPTLHVVVQRAP